MTLEVKVTVPSEEIQDGNAADYLESAMAAIGFARNVSLPLPVSASAAAVEDMIKGIIPRALQPERKDTFVDPVQNEGPEPDDTPDEGDDVQEPGDTPRLYGKAPEAKVRRTKAEIAEDTDIETAAEQAGITIPDGVTVAEAKAIVAGGTAPVVKPNISTGEERIDPTSDEDKAQDAADEAAEVAETRGEALTLDDLRQAAGRFQKKFGMTAAMEIIPQILGCAIHEVEEADIEGAVDALDTYEPDGDAEAAPEAFTATKEDVIEEMLRYAEKYDGQRTDMANMPVMVEDRAKIFQAALGEGVDGLSKVPSDPEAYGQAVLAFREAIEKNPFGRTAK